MSLLHGMIQRLLLLLTWIRSYSELALLWAADLSAYICRPNCFHPIRRRRLSDISRDDCYNFFGLGPHDLARLFRAWRIPDLFRSPYRNVFQGEECFIIFLYYITKGVPFTEMARHTFGGDPRYFSQMFDEMVNHLYFTFYNKISGNSLDQWIPQYVDRCRRLIHDALSSSALFETTYVDGEAVNEAWILHHFDFNTFRIFGFLDDLALRTARPGGEPSQRLNIVHNLQRSFYSGYLRSHGLKAQVVYLPIGLIGSVFITELRQNDNGVQNMSGLNDYLVRLLSGFLIGGLLPCLYGDAIFSTLLTIIPRFSNPTPALHLLNLRLVSLREIIEPVFADHS